MSKEITIHSRKLGCEFNFVMDEGGGYVRLYNRTTGNYDQICQGGNLLRGSTIKSSPASFEADVRRWYRAHIKSID